MDATLYTDEDSFDSMVLRWIVLEKECPLVIKTITASVRNTVKLPYFQDRGFALFDHHVVLQYLQERYPGEELLPADPQLRGQIRQICTLIRETENGDSIVDDLNSMLKPNEYLVGPNFSLADIYAGAWLQTSRALPKALPIRVDNYRKRLALRPAYKEAVQ